MSSRLLADALARSLSDNAARHLRAARVARQVGLSSAPEALRAQLLLRGFPAPEALLDLEARAGGATFPDGRILGATCFLQACPSLRVTDLPAFEGKPAFPVFGVAEHLEEWESPFGLLSASGTIAMFDAPRGPVRAYSSLEHLLEMVALAPLSDEVHTLRVDGLCGDVVAGLLDANPHSPAASEQTSGWVGDGVWVTESKIALPDDSTWSSFRGTFVSTERPALLLELIPLLLEQGFSLGHRGPVSAPAPGAEPVLTFVDHHPELGYRATVRVSVWNGKDGPTFSRLEERDS